MCGRRVPAHLASASSCVSTPIRLLGLLAGLFAAAGFTGLFAAGDFAGLFAAAALAEPFAGAFRLPRVFLRWRKAFPGSDSDSSRSTRQLMDHHADFVLSTRAATYGASTAPVSSASSTTAAVSTIAASAASSVASAPRRVLHCNGTALFHTVADSSTNCSEHPSHRSGQEGSTDGGERAHGVFFAFVTTTASSWVAATTAPVAFALAPLRGVLRDVRQSQNEVHCQMNTSKT